MQLFLMDFNGLTASVYVYNKLGDVEPIDIKHHYLRKHCASAESHIEAEYTVFWNLAPQRYAQLGNALIFR